MRRNVIGSRRKAAGSEGYTLFEMLIALTILGILLGFLVVPVRESLHRARALRTRKVMQDAGETWCMLQAAPYPPVAGGPDDPAAAVPLADFPFVLNAEEVSDLGDLLGARLPREDAWGEEIEYRVDTWPEASILLLRSRNVDRRWQPEGLYDYPTLLSPRDREGDLVYANCAWAQAPDPGR